MMTEANGTTIGVLLSGGLDSSILLGHLLEQGRAVQPFFVRSHLVWETAELAAARMFLNALKCPALQELVVLELPVDDLYQGHWSITGDQTPDAHSPDEAVFLPGRNALLLTKAAIWCSLRGVGELTMAPLGTSPFPDASPEFFASFERMFQRLGLPEVQIVLPFAGMNKGQVMELGTRLPLELTFSCIAPSGGLHCGTCNKCAERRAAFQRAQREDRTRYADN